MAATRSCGWTFAGSADTVAVRVARFTAASFTPGTPDSPFSTRATHEAHDIPSTGRVQRTVSLTERSTEASGAWVAGKEVELSVRTLDIPLSGRLPGTDGAACRPESVNRTVPIIRPLSCPGGSIVSNTIAWICCYNPHVRACSSGG